MMKRPLETLALILIAITLSSPLLANDRYGKQKVVYHVNGDDAQAQVAALRNVQNHVNAVGADNIELKIVMHGDGVSLVMDPDYLEGTKMKNANATSEMQARIAGLKQQGVAFEVCANTLKGRNIPRDALYDVEDADIVPSGVAELSRLQQMGFTYIKP
ncbi:DsrE family protein [Thiorhodococcus fuscus]|uniref:DsrE family protein n=1 Tax=Thiorhodococcus fuscus TaxID=527200 RepID=A0ABW4YCU2_9GAMM